MIMFNKFYILEFTNARYIFFKKDSFSGKDEFDKLIAEIEEIGWWCMNDLIFNLWKNDKLKKRK